MQTPFDNLGRSLECLCRIEGDCVCLPSEKALRLFAQGQHRVAMTDPQREWSVEEAGSVEGYDRLLLEGLDDRCLAAVVLTAWAEYVADKGLR